MARKKQQIVIYRPDKTRFRSGLISEGRFAGFACWWNDELLQLLGPRFAGYGGDPIEILHRLFPDKDDRRRACSELLLLVAPYDDPLEQMRHPVEETCRAIDPFCFEAELARRIDRADTIKNVVCVESKEAERFFTSLGYTSAG